MLRLGYKKKITDAIKEMRQKHMFYVNVPYHFYPFSEELNMNNQNYQHYIFRTTLEYYLSIKCNKRYFGDSNILLAVLLFYPYFINFQRKQKFKSCVYNTGIFNIRCPCIFWL